VRCAHPVGGIDHLLGPQMYVRDGVLVAVGVWIGATAMSCRRATTKDAASPTTAGGSDATTELEVVASGSHPNSTPYSWPGGKRLAVYFAINLEHFEFGKGMGAKLGGQCAFRATQQPLHLLSLFTSHSQLSCYGRACSFGEPDVLNYSWRDYGAII
jgi:hypothetical protein